MAEEELRSSRFDQREPGQQSRFDRRSRSPPRDKNSQKYRSRSPHSKTDSDENASASKAAAAKSAADRIAKAQAQAAKISQQVKERAATATVNAASPPPTTPGSAKSPSAGGDKPKYYEQDGDFVIDYSVNDLRNRYTLTKGAFQKQIKEETGADVTTRGNYYPNASMATSAKPALYLHVTSTSKEGLEKAVAKIDEMAQQDLPNLVDERRFRRREPPPEVERDELGRKKWPHEDVPVDLEPIHGFNLRAKVVGQQGANVKHIQTETGCRVQIKGRGSGFKEPATGIESDEPMYLHCTCPDATKVADAKEQCISLLESVRNDYMEFKSRSTRMRGGRNGPYDQGGYNQHRDSNPYEGTQNPMSPTDGQYSNQQGAPQGTQQADWWSAMAGYAQYYQQWAEHIRTNPDADPLKDSGGFENNMQWYYYYLQQGQGAGQPQENNMQPQDMSQLSAMGQTPLAQHPGGEAPAPPPPETDQQTSPPPPPGQEAYNNAPPPPGL